MSANPVVTPVVRLVKDVGITQNADDTYTFSDNFKNAIIKCVQEKLDRDGHLRQMGKLIETEIGKSNEELIAAETKSE